ncbi:MAG: LacI family DNA-binding transcriptional regulator [Bifidobacteriaceae bacterium]|jgi:DNA-binding LacI/PurR family transcriptional regulator|nr:LacI family DNA-binding transcriptional regulator [Bifidobacteriaceae bacterium]
MTSPAVTRSRQATGPSISDVARLAGVSAQTVSRVSTGTGPVRHETKERVLAAMAALGYSPNTAARALKYGSYRTFGIVAHQLARTGESRTIEAVVEAARGAGYTVTLVDVESPSSSGVNEAMVRLTQQAIDGLIIIRAETVTPTALTLPPNLPVVVSDSRLASHHPAVGTDQVTGTRQAVEHLLALGHRTVHHLAGPDSSDPARIRAATWRATLLAAGREVPALLTGDWTSEAGYRVGQELAVATTSGPTEARPTAVFTSNDEMAFGLIRALHEHGLRVPQDISVAGFDDIPLAAYLWPPLTTVHQDFPAIGSALVELLLRQLNQREVLTDTRVVVPTRLVVRESTAPPQV